MAIDEDDKTTVVLDLNALKKQKLKQEEELASIAQELEFAGLPEDRITETVVSLERIPQKVTFPIILFDLQSDYFKKNKHLLPIGYEYHIVSTLADLNKFLSTKKFQIIVLNYDVNPKAINQITLQIKKKFPLSKTLIMARSISPAKAKIHANTPSGASGYYQFPLNPQKVDDEFSKIYSALDKNS